MRKLAIILAVATLAVAPAMAQSKKDVQNARTEAKAAAKTLRRDGFKPLELGDVTTRLEKYFLKQYAGCTQVIGTADGCLTTNLAQVTALANAANLYALTAGGEVRARIVSSASSLSGQQIDNLVSSFERLVAKEIRGELVPFVTLVRDRKGHVDARAYCIVDLDGACQLRKRALEIALEEQALAEKYGTMVSEWIDEGFNKEEE